MRTLTALVLALPLAVAAATADKNAAATADKTAAATADKASAGAGTAGDGANAYRIEATKGPLKLKKGAAGSAHVEVVPRADAHVSPDAPLSVLVTSGPGLKPAKAKLVRADTHETKAKGVEFDVPFTAEAAGKDELKATVSFFICTEKLCERQKRDVTLAVLVE